MKVEQMPLSRWDTAVNQEVRRLKGEGWATSGDAASILGIHASNVRAVCGQPGLVVRRGGVSVFLWRRDLVESKKATRRG